MKSLSSIILKLSPNEIETFRTFLINNSRTLKNKKLDLFNKVVDGKDFADLSGNSRQSEYQLKKRLQEQLYSFLMSQEQTKTDDQLFLEMDCHKKLYCFKILLDKGIHDHALQLLEEIMSIAEKNSLNGIYLDAVNLRNTYFPLKQNRNKKEEIEGKIKKLTHSLGHSLYVNHYLTTSNNQLHDSDQSFRESLMEELHGFSTEETELVVERLISINNVFSKLDFASAYDQLVNLTDHAFINTVDENMRGLIFIELTKACICLDKFEEASEWLLHAESVLRKYESFSPIVLELQLTIMLRTGESKGVRSILMKAERHELSNKNEILRFKWSYYALWNDFQDRQFRQVIKTVNGNPVFSTRIKNGLVYARFLEVLCIFQLSDWDWLHYKIDSFRKVISGLDNRFPRIMQTISSLKNHTNGKTISYLDVNEALLATDYLFPWHPLGLELVNTRCDLVIDPG